MDEPISVYLDQC